MDTVLILHGIAFLSSCLSRCLHVASMPYHHRMRQDMQTGRLVVLVFLLLVRYDAIADEAQQHPQLMPCLAFVELGVHPLTPGLVCEGPQENDRFDEPPILLEEVGQVMLARRGLQLTDEQRGAHLPAFACPCDPSEMVPSIKETRRVNAACEARLEPFLPRRIVLQLREPLMAYVTDTRGKLHPQHITEGNHSSGIPCGIRCVLQDRQVRLSVEDCVKHVRGSADSGRKHLRPILGTLLTGPRREGHALPRAAVSRQRHGVADLAPDGKPLAIRGREGAAAPLLGQGGCLWDIDQRRYDGLERVFAQVPGIRPR